MRSKKAPWVVQYKTWSKLLSTAHARKPDIIPAYSDLQKRKMYSFIDQSEGEMVAFEDLEAALFGGAFLAEPQAGRDTESLLQDRLWRILYSRRHLFRDLLLRVDEEATGLVDVDEFRAALEVRRFLVECVNPSRRLTSSTVALFRSRSWSFSLLALQSMRMGWLTMKPSSPPSMLWT